MSVKALQAVFEHSRSTGNARVVLLALADWADPSGEAWPSLGAIARKANASRSTVIRSLMELEELGELQRVTGGGRAGRGGTSNRYRLTVAPPSKQSQSDTTSEGKRSQADTPSPPKRSQADTPSTRKRSQPDTPSVPADAPERPEVVSKRDRSGVTVDTRTVRTVRTTNAPSASSPSQRNGSGPAKPAAKKAPRRATAPPRELPVTEAMETWARAHGITAVVPDLSAETERMLDWHRAKGSTMKDWVAAWRTWMRNQLRWAERNGTVAAAARRDPHTGWVER